MKYLLMATLGTVLFFGGYWLLMRRDTHFGMLRAYLTGSLILAMLLPAVHLKLPLPTHFSAKQMSEVVLSEWQTTPDRTSVSTPTADGGNVQLLLRQDAQGVSRFAVQHQAATPQKPWWQVVLPWVWLTGCVVSATILLLTVVRLRRKLHRMPTETIDTMSMFGNNIPIRLSVLNDETPAFSFGNHIVVGRQGFSDCEVQQLVGHELVHVRQLHSADLIMCRMARAVLWFNPFVWLYERELKRVHEYIADRAMFQSDSGTQYAELFYHQLSGRLFSPLCNTFDYRLVGKRIAMMTKEPPQRKNFKWLVFVPIAAVILAVGCVPKGTLDGLYHVDRLMLMSDNPVEPDLECADFMGMKNFQFIFSRDGHLCVTDRDGYGKTHQCTYTLDDSGLHIYDSTGKTWLDMTLETRHCDGDSIVLRFVDSDPVGGLAKMLQGLPVYRYRVDTVNVSSSTTGPNGEMIEVNPHKELDTAFASVVVFCPLDNDKHWNKGNRLLSSSAPRVATFITEFADENAQKKTVTGTQWEFDGDTITAGAREIYDTNSSLNPRMDGDRFILEVVLIK